MSTQILIEHFSPAEAALVESRDAQKNLYLAGRMMAAEQENLNHRKYPKSEIDKAVAHINQKIKEGAFIMGELNHPDNLSIDLKNVSHIITEAWMDGNNAVGKCKILNTPSGLIVQSLIEGGVRPGVSSRGTGNVNSRGIVEDFAFVTLDIVAQPSGPGCYPDVVREAQGDKKIMTLAEAVVHDEKAQKYFKAEIKKFLESIMKK
jgi:hypothetical protein